MLPIFLVFLFTGILMFFLGACVGSAYLCYLFRKRSGESWTKGRSHCDSCGHVLGLRDLIPVFSYLASKGKCRYCGAKIPKLALKAELRFGFGFLELFLWIVVIAVEWIGGESLLLCSLLSIAGTLRFVLMAITVKRWASNETVAKPEKIKNKGEKL